MKKITLSLLVSASIFSCTTEVPPTGPVPANGPAGVTFTDTDATAAFGGPITITRAADESDITSYRIKWGGSGNCAVVGNQITEVDVAGQGDIVFDLPAGTSKPDSAEKVLAFSANENGENASCASVDIVSNQPGPQVPANAPTSVSFTDIDDGQTIGGDITIGRAVDESDITHYVLRFGSGGCNVQNSFIAEVAVTGSDITYQLPSNTAIPAGATELLAYSKNDVGEMADCDNAATVIDNVVNGGGGSGWVMIQHSSGKCLDAIFSGRVRLGSDCDVNDLDLRWEIMTNGNDYQIRHIENDECIEYTGSSFIPFETMPCSSVEFQVMRFEESSTGTYYEISNDSSLGAVCIESSGNSLSTVDGTIGNCSLGSEIQWQVLDAGVTVIQPPFGL